MKLLYVTNAISLLFLMFIIFKNMSSKNAISYKTAEKGAWLIYPSPVAKFILFILLLSWGSTVAFDEPNIQRIKGQGKFRCFDKSDPLCIDGYFRRTNGETALVIAMGVSMILISLVVLAEKGVVIDRYRARKIWEISPLKFSIEVALENAIVEDGTKEDGKAPIIKISDAKSGKNFRVSFPYTRQDINFVQVLIRERRMQIVKEEIQTAQQNSKPSDAITEISKDQNDPAKI